VAATGDGGAAAGANAGAAPLLAVAAAALEVQHYAPPLLAALAGAAAAAGAARLPPEQLADMLLVLAFFRAAPPGFVADATAALGAALGGGGGGGFGAPAPGARGPAPPPGSDDSGAGGGLGEGAAERAWRAAALLTGAGAPVDARLLRALAARPPQRLLAIDHMVSDPEAAADAAAQPQGPEWEAAGLLTPAQVVERLREGLGLGVAQGAIVGGGGALRAAVPLSVVVPLPAPGGGGSGGGPSSSRRVAVAVLDDDCYCASPEGRLRGSAAAQVLALQALGCAVMPLPVHEWRGLGGDAERQDAYLRARIAAAVG
jgi:hypothetical protein